MPQPRDNTQFDDRIKAAHSLFLLPFDWRLAKAQLIAESKLLPSAKSGAGAMGLAQFMPNTWADVVRALHMPSDSSPYDASAAIKCHAYYMAKILSKWTAPRPEIDRYCLALASYNAGIGNVLKAQNRAGGSNDYKIVISQLANVTGADNSKQTRDYVQRILTEWQAMILGF